jgi:hypothetical protein
MAIPGTDQATVGSQIPRLLLAASGNFSIPLDSTILLSQFAKWNMTCSAENALMTFPGFASKRSASYLSPEEGFNVFVERDEAAFTSNGIVIAGSATPAPAPAVTASTMTLPGAVSPAPTGGSAPGTNATSRDFAKVGILFVLQDSEVIYTAVKAQEKLSTYLTSANKEGSTVAVARNITLGNGYFINLWDLTVTLHNGTVYGNGFNGTATAMPSPEAAA